MASLPRVGVVAAMAFATTLSPADIRAAEVVSLALLLPRRAVAGRLEGAAISEPAVHAGRMLAIVTTPPDGAGGARDDLLFCVDRSDAAEGRIEWTAPPPPGMVRFESAPWVEGERVRAVVIGEGPRAARMIASFDLFNGRCLGVAPGDRPRGPGGIGR